MGDRAGERIRDSTTGNVNMMILNKDQTASTGTVQLTVPGTVQALWLQADASKRHLLCPIERLFQAYAVAIHDLNSRRNR
jgi:hypothetical protein